MESVSNFGELVIEVFIKEFNKSILEPGVIISESTQNTYFGEKYHSFNLTKFFVKWIVRQVKGFEWKQEPVKKFNKVMLVVESKEDVLRVHALSCDLKFFFQEDSINIKEKLFKKEPVNQWGWPNRWFVDVRLFKESIVSCVWYLPQVERLKMRECFMDTDQRLNFVPDDIGYMKHLRVLNLQHNHLKRLPFALTLCEKLEELLIEYNSFSYLPEFIVRLPRINKLYRFHNRFFSDEFNIIREIQTFKKEFKRESLYLMSLKSFLRQINIYDLNNFLKSFPAHLHPDALKLIYDTCSNCHRFILHDEGFMFIYPCQSFVNCSYVPVAVYTCSSDCAKISLNQKTMHTIHCDAVVFDIPKSLSNSSLLSNSKLRRIKRFICF